MNSNLKDKRDKLIQELRKATTSEAEFELKLRIDAIEEQMANN